MKKMGPAAGLVCGRLHCPRLRLCVVIRVCAGFVAGGREYGGAWECCDGCYGAEALVGCDGCGEAVGGISMSLRVVMVWWF